MEIGPILEIEVNGVFEDFSDIVALGGIEWSRNDIDSEKTGRSKLDAKMHRKRLAVKRKLKVSCLQMGIARMKHLNEAILPETVRFRFWDPLAGARVIHTFYGSTVSTTTLFATDNEMYWDKTSFNVTEV